MDRGSPLSFVHCDWHPPRIFVSTHLGKNWYFLGAVEVPVAHVKSFDYQVLGAIMKVF